MLDCLLFCFPVCISLSVHAAAADLHRPLFTLGSAQTRDNQTKRLDSQHLLPPLLPTSSSLQTALFPVDISLFALKSDRIRSHNHPPPLVSNQLGSPLGPPVATHNIVAIKRIHCSVADLDRTPEALVRLVVLPSIHAPVPILLSPRNHDLPQHSPATSLQSNSIGNTATPGRSSALFLAAPYIEPLSAPVFPSNGFWKTVPPPR